MARVKKAMNARKKHKKVLKLAKGFRGSRSKLFRPANAFVMKAFAGLYNLLLDPMNPFASFNTFLCFLRAFIAFLTLAIVVTSFNNL